MIEYTALELYGRVRILVLRYSFTLEYDFAASILVEVLLELSPQEQNTHSPLAPAPFHNPIISNFLETTTLNTWMNIHDRK